MATATGRSTGEARSRRILIIRAVPRRAARGLTGFLLSRLTGRAGGDDKRKAPEMIPPEVVTALAGQPVVGSWKSMFPLLTVDGSGFPHVCLLSRAELRADQQFLCW